MSGPGQADRVREEVADVFAYLLRLADVLEIDLAAALRDKVRRNEQRYPVSLAKGRADKYDRLVPMPRLRDTVVRDALLAGAGAVVVLVLGLVEGSAADPVAMAVAAVVVAAPLVVRRRFRWSARWWRVRSWLLSPCPVGLGGLWPWPPSGPPPTTGRAAWCSSARWGGPSSSPWLGLVLPARPLPIPTSFFSGRSLRVAANRPTGWLVEARLPLREGR